MYKSKLLMLCQGNSWDLPEFSTSKSGPDHNHIFSSTVTVNGLAFNTTDQSRTSKEAQSKAAKIAFDYFSSLNSYPKPFPNFPQPSLVEDLSISPFATSAGLQDPIQNNLDIGLSMGGISQPTTEIIQSPRMNETPFGVKDENKFIDMCRLYKNQLQNYVQKRNLPMPEYSSEREGPPHASRFRSKVVIDGKTYGSLDFFMTIKEAEHAAAKIALESLSVNDVQEDDSVLYKNLLQELTQKKGLGMPKYETNTSGPSHMRTFVSTVEIEGESFEGQAAKSKKQAETNAAMIAYTGLKEHKESVASGKASVMIIPAIFHSGCEIKKALEASSSILQSVIIDDFRQSTGPKSSLVDFKGHNDEDIDYVLTGDLQPRDGPKANLVHEGQDEEYKVGHEAKFSSNTTTTNPGVQLHHAPPPSPDTDINTKRLRSCTSAAKKYAGPSHCTTSSLPQNGEANVMNAFPREKTFVYPRMPNMQFPDGATVLPFSDDKWVAVKMNSNQ